MREMNVADLLYVWWLGWDAQLSHGFKPIKLPACLIVGSSTERRVLAKLTHYHCTAFTHNPSRLYEAPRAEQPEQKALIIAIIYVGL